MNESICTVYYVIAPGCEDEADKYLDAVQNVRNVHLEPLEMSREKKVQCCIYITGFSSGVTAADIAAVDSRVPSWLIVVSQLETRRARNDYKIVKEKWEMSLADKDIALKVLAGSDGYENNLLDWVNKEIEYAAYGAERIYLITSPNPRSGKTSFIRCFEADLDSNTDYKIIEAGMDSYEYESLRSKATKIIFICDERSGFNIPPFDDCLRKSVFVLNKCDNRPIFFKNADNLKLSVINILRKNGWELSPEHTSRIFLFSALYSEYLRKYKNGDLTLDFFITEGDFAVWDDFGLPIPRSEYTPESVNAVLEGCDYLPYLKNYIFNRGARA